MDFVTGGNADTSMITRRRYGADGMDEKS